MLNLLLKIRPNNQIYSISKKKNNLKFAVARLIANNGLNTIKKINASPNNAGINIKTTHKINLTYSKLFK